MTSEAIPAKPASASRVTLAIITEPWQANPNDTIHGGVILKLVDECGAIAALRHAGKGQITTAAIDSMTFLGPVYVGERVEISAEVTYAGRTSIETRIEVFAEPIENAVKRKVGVGYGLYVALDREPAAPAGSPAIDRDRGRSSQSRGSTGSAGGPACTPRRGAWPVADDKSGSVSRRRLIVHLRWRSWKRCPAARTWGPTIRCKSSRRLACRGRERTSPTSTTIGPCQSRTRDVELVDRTAQPFLEFDDTLAQGTAHLGQALAEEQNRHAQEHHHLEPTNVGNMQRHSDLTINK